jgi:hypothetical protein
MVAELCSRNADGTDALPSRRPFKQNTCRPRRTAHAGAAGRWPTRAVCARWSAVRKRAALWRAGVNVGPLLSIFRLSRTLPLRNGGGGSADVVRTAAGAMGLQPVEAPRRERGALPPPEGDHSPPSARRMRACSDAPPCPQVTALRCAVQQQVCACRADGRAEGRGAVGPSRRRSAPVRRARVGVRRPSVGTEERRGAARRGLRAAPIVRCARRPAQRHFLALVEGEIARTVFAALHRAARVAHACSIPALQTLLCVALHSARSRRGCSADRQAPSSPVPIPPMPIPSPKPTRPLHFSRAARSPPLRRGTRPGCESRPLRRQALRTSAHICYESA